jgi:hypothetical protein
MPRNYERSVDWKEDIDVPDWELLDAAVELLTQQATAEDRFSFSAEDERGTYRAAALDEFRAEVAAADEPPNHMTFVYSRDNEREPSLYYQLSLKRPGYVHAHTFAVIESADEGLAVLLRERSEVLLRKASERRKARIAAQKERVAETAPPSMRAAAAGPQSFWDKYGMQIIIGLAVSVVAGFIVAAILGAFS